MPIEQWVNLPKEDGYATDGIGSKKSLGALEIELTFESEEPATAEYKLEPVGGNAAYSEEESKRHLRFKPRNDVGTAQVLGATTVKATIDLPAAGGDVFKVKARCNGAEKVTEEIHTRRRLFYKSVTMEGVAGPDLGVFESTFWNADKKYYIQWKKLDAGGTVADKPVLNKMKSADLFKDNKDVIDLGDRAPYGMTVIWVKKLFSQRTEGIEDTKLSLDLPKKGEAFAPVAHVLARSTTRRLMRDVEPDDDKDRAWLESLKCTFTPHGGKAVDVPIPHEQIARKDEKLEITLTDAQIDHLRGEAAVHGKFTFTGNLNVMSPITGFQSPSGKAVVVATILSTGKARGSAELLQTLIHEAGHMIGMAADGPTNPKRPDKHGSFYTAQGHVGPHCQKPAAGQGLSWNAGTARWTGTPGCVMFGGTHSSDGKPAPNTFCDDCAPQVRKVDLHHSSL